VFIDELRARNIGSSVHFIPVHMHPYYAARPETHPHPLTVAEEIFKGIVSLPLYPKMTDDDVLDVILSVTEIVGEGLK